MTRYASEHHDSQMTPHSRCRLTDEKSEIGSEAGKITSEPHSIGNDHHLISQRLSVCR